MRADPGSPSAPDGDDPLSLRAHTVRGLFWAGVQRMVGQALALVAFIILSRLLHPSAFGVLALANAYLLVALLVVEQGIHQPIVQRSDLSRDHLDTAFSISLGLSVLLALLTLAVAAPLAGLFDEPMLAPVLRALAPTLILSGLRATQTALLQRQMRFRDLALRTGAAEIIGGAFGIGMAVAGAGVWSLVGQAFGRGIGAVVVLWHVADWWPRLRVVRPRLREIGHFSLPILGDRLVQLIQGKADDLIIGFVLGATALGYYSVGYRVLTYLTQLVVGTIQSVALPVLSRLQGDAERFRRIFLAMLEYLSLVAFPVFVGIALVAPDAVPVVLGDRWSPSIPAMQILALAGAVKALPLAAGTALVAFGRPALQFRVNVATATMSVLGFVAAVGHGIAAVGAVHLAVGIMAMTMYAFVLKSVLAIPGRAFGRPLLAPLAGAALMASALMVLGAVRMIPPPSARLLALGIGGGAAVYAGTVFLLGRESIDRAQTALRQALQTSGPLSATEIGSTDFSGPVV